MICLTSSQIPVKQKSVFKLGDFQDPKKIHEDMLAARKDFERLIAENNELKEITNNEQ